MLPYILKKLSIFTLFIALTPTAWADGPTLTNYLGTGTHPRLSLNLSANAMKAAPFSIDYQQAGNMPCSNDLSKNWSTWDVKDETGTYFGTVTLTCSGYTVNFTNYNAKNSGGNYLEGVNFNFNKKINSYQLTVDKIVINNPSANSPFPNTPLATPAIDTKTKMPIIWHTQGATILDQNGTIVLLKGVVRPSLEWNPQGQNLSPQDITNMKTWGANVIRVDLNQAYWFASAPVTTSGSYKQVINAIVYNAIQNHMAVILDLHWTDHMGQSSMANRDSLQFWHDVANDYKSFGTVIFELFNEPVAIDTQTWLNGNANYAGYQELVGAVRSTGAHNLCIVNGLDYGYDLSFVNNQFRVKGDNIIYGSHPYNEKGKPGYTGPGRDFDYNFQGIIGSYPLIFTEFGVNDAAYFPQGYVAVYQRILAYANLQNINYSAFAWWVDTDHADIFPDVIADWQGTPLNGGVMIHDDLQTHPGTNF